MRPGSQLTTHSHMPEDFSDQRSISGELQLKLPGELVEIEGNRLRIEAVIARLDIGDVLRHLCIAALTPGHKNIVRYELDTLPSGALASNLAALISRAKDKNVPAETVMQSIQECLQNGGPFFFRKIEPDRNPLVMPSMERMIPDFDKFARNPLLMDTSFSVERDVPGAHIKAVATLFPLNRYTLIEVHTFSTRAPTTPQIGRFKVRSPESFWEKPRTTEAVIAALHSATWAAMDTIISKGAESARRESLDPELDNRLIQGVVNAASCDTAHILPSGARILLEEGDRLVCVRIESSDEAASTAVFWRIFGQEALFVANEPKLITARSAVEALAEGDLLQRFKAIQTLDRLEQAYTAQMPAGAFTVEPFQTISLEQLVGFQTAQTLTELRRTKTEVVSPNSPMLILDILAGIQSIQLSPRETAHSEHVPQDPNYLFFGFRSDGALKITVISPLQNYVETILPASHFEESPSREKVVERLASLFNRNTSRDFMTLRREIESLSLRRNGDSCDSTKLRPAVQRFPSIENKVLANALDTAADIALVYKTDAKGSINDIHVNFADTTQCELVVSGDENIFREPSMHLHTSEFGVHAIDLLTVEDNQRQQHRFTLESPITIPEGREVLATIFNLLRTLKRETRVNSPAAEIPLRSTPLFKYLQECEERFSER